MRKGLKKGFTLIELLVVIAIIAILATVVIINVTGARQKSARAKISADLSQAIKVANACTSFGSATPLNAYATAALAAGSAICAEATVAGIPDPTERAAATGTWPTSFRASPFTGTAVITTSAITTLTSASAANGTLTCTITGCTSPATW